MGYEGRREVAVEAHPVPIGQVARRHEGRLPDRRRVPLLPPDHALPRRGFLGLEETAPLSGAGKGLSGRRPDLRRPPEPETPACHERWTALWDSTQMGAGRMEAHHRHLRIVGLRSRFAGITSLSCPIPPYTIPFVHLLKK